MTTDTKPDHHGSPNKAPVFISLLIAVLVAITAAYFAYQKFSASTHTRDSTNYPNIIFIIADDIGWDDYGFNNKGLNNPVIRTPNIDKLASEGVLFNNAYTPNSICRPSLASIITGLYPSQHGITANARALNQRREKYRIGLPPYAKRMQQLDTLPRELSKQGYRSLQTGKWWEEGYRNGGFDEGDKEPQGLFREVTRMNVIGREGLEPIFRFIDHNRQQPFFIWYAPQMPHTPHNPPAEFVAPYIGKTPHESIAKYYGMVTWFDHTVGQIVTHLESQGLRENTLIVYMADNGVATAVDGGVDEGKDSPYEKGIRTPIIFNWPSHWQAAQRDALISNIDVFPTVLDLLQVPTADVSGASVLPTIIDGKPPARDFVAGEGYPDPGKEIFDSPRKFRWIRFQHWKLIWHDTGKIELFNLSSDPGEKNNLAGDASLATLQKQLREKLDNTLPEVKP